MLFNDFVNSFSTNKCVANSCTAQGVYSIIWREDTRIKMAELSDVNISALTACAQEIEELCSSPTSDLDLSDNTVRQTIGRMIAVSLAPLGYSPEKRGRINIEGLQHFTSAKVYSFTGDAEQRIVKHIVDITE